MLFAAFVLLADAHHPLPGLLAVAIVLLVAKRDAVLKIDWLLLLIFVLMFVVLRSALPVIHDTIAHANLDSPLRIFAAGAVLSQGISNVPAAILLSEFTHDWRALAFGVSVGGFGFAIGSLANLIAVRLAKEPRMWLPFHLVSIPFALASAARCVAARSWLNDGACAQACHSGGGEGAQHSRWCGVVDKCRNPQSIDCGGMTTD